LSLPVYIYSYCDYIQIGPGGKSLLQGCEGYASCPLRQVTPVRAAKTAVPCLRPRARVHEAQASATNTSTTSSAIKNS
jgi:hypothetical protein